MENRFEKYLMWRRDESGKIIDATPGAVENAHEAFELFKQLYNTHYGSIYEEDNLVSIHTGGWSDNEELIEEFRHTAWWFINHKITASGGHYYFNTDTHADKEWKIITISTD